MIEHLNERAETAWSPGRDYYEAVALDPVVAVLDADGETPAYLLAVVG
ncbi:MAG: hypothetical protein HOV86_22475 [Thermoactinospora sp.]|nr:hypothetical protein [Thermoactinospora sp.]